jgi:hypothetical protein
MDYRVQPWNICFPCSTDWRRKAICDHRSKGVAVKAARVLHNPQGPAGYGRRKGQRVASYSASLSLRIDLQTLYGAARNELAVATLLWQRQQGQQ